MLQQIDQGVYLLPKTKRAAELARQHNVSLRTAYRWIESETKPRPDPVPQRSQLWKELRFAAAALKRADKHASSTPPNREEITALENIAGCALGILDKWRARR